MAKLTGTNPDQVPTNADLGTMAYQDKDNVNVGSFTSNGIDDNATSTAMTLDSSGNVRISGDLTGLRYFDIYNTGSTSTDGALVRLITEQVGSTSTTSADIIKRKNGEFRISNFDQDPAAYIAFTIGTTEHMRIDSAGDVDITSELIAGSYNETYAAVTSSSNATTVNCEAGNAFSHTLTENTTFTFSNPPASGTAYSFSIEIIQDASASGFVVTWPSSVDWPSATAPTLTATASAKDVFVFTTRDGGTNWYGFTAGQALG